jgi:hypothetical protein
MYYVQVMKTILAIAIANIAMNTKDVYTVPI